MRSSTLDAECPQMTTRAELIPLSNSRLPCPYEGGKMRLVLRSTYMSPVIDHRISYRAYVESF